jgi:hypothetical protein
LRVLFASDDRTAPERLSPEAGCFQFGFLVLTGLLIHALRRRFKPQRAEPISCGRPAASTKTQSRRRFRRILMRIEFNENVVRRHVCKRRAARTLYGGESLAKIIVHVRMDDR